MNIDDDSTNISKPVTKFVKSIDGLTVFIPWLSMAFGFPEFLI
jgi:hypothetical protein